MNSTFPYLSCPCCPWNRKPIMGEGPLPCSILLIGEGPARDEVKQDRPFAGKAGKEMDYHYLPLAGLVRPEVRVDNATHCPMPGFANPEPWRAMECSKRHLPQELRHCQPSLIVLMGAIACSLADTPIDLDTDHGLPQHNSLLGGLWEGEVFPTFHPAAGLHEGQMMLALRRDFASLGAHLKGKLVLPVDEFPNPQRRLLRGAGEVLEVLGGGYHHPGDWDYLEAAVDTESDCGKAWCLSFALNPYQGYVVLKSDSEGLAAFSAWCRQLRPMLLLHYKLHDVPVLREMGVEVPRCRDTMMDAYHLADVPQGLKALGWRLLGVRMKSWEETVKPHSLPVALSYLSDAGEILGSSLTFQHQLKSGPRKGQQEERVLPGADKEALATWRKVQKAIREPDADPWQRWKGWHDRDRNLLSQILGRGLPFPSIAYVPLEEAVDYAGLDAVVTLRVHHALRRRRIVL